MANHQDPAYSSELSGLRKLVFLPLGVRRFAGNY